MATTSLPWHTLLPNPKSHRYKNNNRRISLSTRRNHAFTTQAFRRSDFDGFAKRVASGEAWKDAWRSANDGFEQLLYDAKKAAERIDRQYSVSRRVSSLAESAAYKARELDREYEIGQKWRSFSLDFSRNFPRYRKQLSDSLSTPVGRSLSTIFFLWFALSGWLFRILFVAVWVLPFAAPLVIRTIANNFVIEGACPACKKRFVGYKSQVIRCTSCGNTVWQPKTSDIFSKGSKGSSRSSSSSSAAADNIIDVEFEER